MSDIICSLTNKNELENVQISRLIRISMNILNIHKTSISNCVTENSIHVIMENI